MRRLATAVLAALAAAPGPGAARAQMADMGGTGSEAAPYGAPIEDAHVWSHLLVDQLEARLPGDGGAGLRWEAEAWAGPDAWRFVVRSEGERTARGAVEDGQQEALFDKPLASFWDLQVGARYDLDSGPGRGWAAIGAEGLAPGFVSVTATAYAGSEGRFAGKLRLAHDLRLTNRLIAQPEAELDLYSKPDPARGLSAGLSDAEAGLRVRYEITRKFAPYVGLAWRRTRHRAVDDPAASKALDGPRLALGLRAWF